MSLKASRPSPQSLHWDTPVGQIADLLILAECTQCYDGHLKPPRQRQFPMAANAPKSNSRWAVYVRETAQNTNDEIELLLERSEVTLACIPHSLGVTRSRGSDQQDRFRTGCQT